MTKIRCEVYHCKYHSEGTCTAPVILIRFYDSDPDDWECGGSSAECETYEEP